MRRSTCMRFFTGAAVLAALCALPAQRAAAQSAGAVLEVRIKDQTGGYVPFATVVAEGEGLRVLRTTNDSGRVTLPVLRETPLRLVVRRVGYVPLQTSVTVTMPRQQLELTLGRAVPWALDTVRIRAQRAVSGLVVAAATQTPVAGATIALTGTGQRVTSGEDGSFTLPLVRQRTVTLSVRAPGYAPAFRTERLDENASGEFLILLDSLSSMPNVVQAGMWDAERRIAWRSTTDVSIGGRELRATGATGLADALRTSPTAVEKGLRADDDVCLFVNNEPMPGQTMESFPIESVKMVELYERGGEMIGGLVSRWPANAPCGRAAPGKAAKRPGRVRYAVIWTY